MRSPDRPGATSPHTSNSENCSSVPGTPAPESYLRFSFQELGDTLGVRPGELLTALQEYAGGVEFDVPPPEGSEDFPAPLSPGQICKTPSSVGGGGISGMLVVMQPASSPDPGRMVSSMMTSSRVGSGEVAPPPPATEEPYFDIAGQHQPISQLMEDLAQDAGLAAFFPTDAAGEDLEAPLLWSMEDVVGEHIRTETSESHGYLIKVVEHGMPMFSAPPSPRTSIMSESLPAELSYLQEQLGKEIHEALSNGRIQGQDTYVLALPKTDVSAEDETVAFPSLALPSDIQDIQVVAQVEQDAAGEKVPILQLTIKRVTPFIGYIMLLSAIWGVASLGAGFKMLEPAHPMLKAYWRSCVSVIILSPWTAMSVISNPRCTHSLRDSRICLQLLLTAMGSAGFVGFFVFSLSHCGMETAFLLSNCHSLLIVSWRLISGSPVSLIEGAGVLLGLLGAGIASMDSGTQGPQKGVDTALHLFTALIDAVLVAGNGAQMWSAKALDPDTAGQLFGAVLAFLSGVCGAIYITSAAKVRQKLEMSLFFFLLLSLTSFIFVAALVGATALQGHPIYSSLTLGFDVNTGLFGWATAQRIAPVMLVSVGGTILGTCVYIAVMKYLDPVVVSVAMLSEPFAGVANGVLMGQATWPGILGWVGGVVSVCGALVVMAGSRTRSTTATVH